jgi:hypothetical protein
LLAMLLGLMFCGLMPMGCDLFVKWWCGARVFSVFFGMLKFWHPKIWAHRYFGDSPVF